MPASIRDVSRVAGVSISTVSRVINNAANVNPKIKIKVQEAIEKLNYEPNRIAQSLSGHPFNAIGIAAARATNVEYTSLVLRSIGQYLDEKNYDMILNFSSDEKSEVERCLSMSRGRTVQGLILLGTKTHDSLVERLIDTKTPFIVIGRIEDENLAQKVYSIDTNNLADSMAATKYLFSLGHERIACIHAPLNHVASRDRLDGFIAAHKEAGIPVDHSAIICGGYSIDDAYKVCKEMLSRGKSARPTAVMATDDTKALGLYKAASSLDISIPDDISVVGQNNYEASQMAYPALTTINIPIHDLGVKAAEILLRVISGKSTQLRTLLDTTLIERKSCKRINGAPFL